MTGSNDIAELLTVVPARFNRLVFYDGEAPHSGHIANPDLLSDDLSKGRLTFNFFANAHRRQTATSTMRSSTKRPGQP